MLLALLAACERTPSAPSPAAESKAPESKAKDTAPVRENAATVREPRAASEVVFEGMCDASGAIPLEGNRFAVADDEDNLIRIYDADQGGAPLAVVALPGLESISDEMDLEAATRLGSRGLWLASHGRNKKGARKSSRLHLFLSTSPNAYAPLELVGEPYRGLLEALLASPALKPFELEAAAERSPIAPGGLNIEGMAARQDGGVFIGFRSPVPAELALVVGIANPLQVIEGGVAPAFDSVHRLDLGEGRGVRDLAEWRGRFLVIGGSPTEQPMVSQLYTWDGVSNDVSRAPVDLSGYNPEAFYAAKERERILLLSDDGRVDYGGTLCKRLKSAEAKRFRGVWVKLPGD